jgi:hypothetical protein
MAVNFKPADMAKLDKAARVEGFTRTGSWVASVAILAADAVLEGKPEAQANSKKGGRRG